MNKLIISIVAILMIAGCAKNIESNVYNESDTLQLRSVSKGRVLEVIPVKVEGKKVVGTTSGAIIGGIGGSAVGGTDEMEVLMGSIGALVGSGIGKTIDGWITDQGGYQYIIELRMDGTVVSIVQGDNNPLAVGDEVLLLNNDGETKIIRNTIESK